MNVREVFSNLSCAFHECESVGVLNGEMGREIRRSEAQHQHGAPLVFVPQQLHQLRSRSREVNVMNLHLFLEGRIELQQADHLSTAGTEVRFRSGVEEIRIEQIQLITVHSVVLRSPGSTSSIDCGRLNSCSPKNGTNQVKDVFDMQLYGGYVSKRNGRHQMNSNIPSLYQRIGGREALDTLLRHFYADVRQQQLLGPVFIRHIDDWPEHLAKIGEFWARITGGPSSFVGSLPLKHALLGIDARHFDAWLGLWEVNCGCYLAPREARELTEMAQMIGRRLKNIIGAEAQPENQPSAEQSRVPLRSV